MASFVYGHGMPGEELCDVLNVFEDFFVEAEGDVTQVNRCCLEWHMLLLLWRKVSAVLKGNIRGLDQKHIGMVHLLLTSVVLAHEDFHVTSRKGNSALRSLVDKLSALCPVILRV